MIIQIIIHSENVSNDNDLLVKNPLLRKDIIKDTIGTLPNILLLNCGSVYRNDEIVENGDKLEYLIHDSKSFIGYDIHDIRQPLVKILESDVTHYECDEHGVHDLSEPLPSYKEYLLDFKECSFSKSIYAMIESYYRNDSGVEITKFNGNDAVVDINPGMEFKFVDKYKLLKYVGLENATLDEIDEKSKGVIFSPDKNIIQMKNDSMLEKIFGNVRTKFSVILPTGSFSKDVAIKENDESFTMKYLIDKYDVYAMDSTPGKLFSVVNITYSKLNGLGVRVGSVENAVAIVIDNDACDYAEGLLKSVCLACKSDIVNID